jgi:putative transposase
MTLAASHVRCLPNRYTTHPLRTIELHTDRRSTIISEPVACLVSDLGLRLIAGHTSPMTRPSRKGGLKALKYRRRFPERFGSIEDARSSCWASSIGTTRDICLPRFPALRPHTGAWIQCRQAVVSGAYARRVDRLMHRHLRPREKPEAVWINLPAIEHRNTKLFRNMWQSH